MADSLRRPVRVLLAVGRALVFVLLAASLFCTVLAFCLKQVLFSPSCYRALAEDEAFLSGMTAFVLEDLESECLFYDLPFDTMKTAVTSEQIRVLSREYVDTVYAALSTGQETTAFTVDASVYRGTLDAFFASLPDEKRPRDETAAATIAGELAQSTASVLQAGISDRLLRLGYRYVFGPGPLRTAASLSGWFLAAVLLLAALSLLPIGSTLRLRSYATAGALFVGSAAVYVPLYLARRHDLAGRLAVGDSPLRLYVEGVWNRLITGLERPALAVFVGCCVLLVGAVVVLSWPRRTGNRKGADAPSSAE